MSPHILTLYISTLSSTHHPNPITHTFHKFIPKNHPKHLTTLIFIIMNPSKTLFTESSPINLIPKHHSISPIYKQPTNDHTYNTNTFKKNITFKTQVLSNQTTTSDIDLDIDLVKKQVFDKKMVRYGIIGVGMMGREHLCNLFHLRNEGATVVCVADPHVPSQKVSLEFADSFGWPIKVFSGHKEMLDSGMCDVVVISTPNMTHYQILMDIINHPKIHHVLVEKPLCTTVEDCRKVIEAAKKRPEMLVQVGLEYRYMPPVAKLIDIVNGGRLGHVKMVSIREHRFPFLVKVDNWNRFNCNSGGTLVEKCCHFFDLMTLFVGANPVRVMASGAIDINHKNEVYDGKVPDIIDNAYVIVEFDNGARGMLDLCMFAEGSKNEQEISVIGEDGKGEAFVPENIVRYGLRIEGRDGVRTMRAEDHRIKYDGLHHGSSYLEHLNFLAAVKIDGKKTPAVDLQDGLTAVAIGVAAQLSIEKGRFVSIKEVMS